MKQKRRTVDQLNAKLRQGPRAFACPNLHATPARAKRAKRKVLGSGTLTALLTEPEQLCHKANSRDSVREIHTCQGWYSR